MQNGLPIYIGTILRIPTQNFSYIHWNNFAYPTQNFSYNIGRIMRTPAQKFSYIYIGKILHVGTQNGLIQVLKITSILKN